jgi:branched-chain amino acid transport system substrate-binding protein
MVRTILILQEQLATEKLKHCYKFKLEDGKCGVGNSSTTATQKLLSIDNVKFIIAGCSGETIQAGNLGQQRKVIVIGTLATDPTVRELGDYVFRTYVDIERGIAEISDTIVKDGNHRVAVFTEQIPFTQKIETLLLKQLGDTVVMREEFPANSVDFNTLLTKAKGLQVDALYLNGATPQTVASIVNQAYGLKMKQSQYTYFMPASKAFRDLTGIRSNGIKYIDVPDVTSTSEQYTDFVKRYLLKYSEGANFEFLRRSTFDAVRALVLSIEQAGTQPSVVKNTLAQIQFQGALGSVRFDDKGDILGLNFVLRQLQDGNPVLIE